MDEKETQTIQITDKSFSIPDGHTNKKIYETELALFLKCKTEFIKNKGVFTPRNLNKKDAHHPTPLGLRLNLFDHQKTVLAAMLDLEILDYVTIKSEEQYTRVITHMVSRNIKPNAGIVSEKYGSGKTFMVLAMLVQRPTLPNNPIYYALNDNENTNRIIIKKKFPNNRYLKPALLFVSSSVVVQWNETITKFTDLKMFVISNIYELKKFYKLIKNEKINQYDVILIKNKTISGKFNFNGYVEKKNKIIQRKIYNIIANISRQYCWSRVILDDYDMIKIPYVSGFINTQFTWYISATRHYTSGCAPMNDNLTTIGEQLCYNSVYLKHFDLHMRLYDVFNIKNDPKYTEWSVSVGKPKFWIYSLVNPNKRYIQMIGDMTGSTGATWIMEMLNGDAIETAAEKIGIKSDNITDIFKKILNDKYDQYKLATNTLAFIDTLDIGGFELLPVPTKDDIYYQKDVYKQRPIEYNYTSIKEKVTNVKNKCIALKHESGKAVDRVKDNIREGECPVCTENLEDSDAIIMRCCGKIMCASCGIRGSQLRRKDSSINGRCPYCRRYIALTDLIFLNDGFDLYTIIEENEDMFENEETKEMMEDTVKKTKPPKTKIDALLRIINNEDLPNKVECNLNIPGMLIGTNELPEAPKEHQKTIIFSMFDESLDGIEKKLNDAGVNFKRLCGTAKKLHEISSEFHDSYDGVNVLLINGAKYSSGQNLQSATNLVFMHKIIDHNIEGQIVGRVQRAGRKYKAHIYYILYDDERIYLNDIWKK